MQLYVVRFHLVYCICWHVIVILLVNLHKCQQFKFKLFNLYFNDMGKFSGLDKDLDQWVFHPLLFNLMSILLHT